MPGLVIPRLAAAASVRAAAREHGDDPQPAYSTGAATLRDDELSAYVDGLLADTREGTPRPEGYVPSTHLWWVEGTIFLGRIHVRHRLTPFLRAAGGHVGYHVVPPHRRRGHATAMLAAALPVAEALGIDCLLLSGRRRCRPRRSVIENNGGLFHDQRGAKLRFWLPTG